MEKCPAHPATVENLNFPHKNISGWLKILTCGSHCPQKLWDRSLASAVRHRYGIRNVSSGFAALAAAVGWAGGRGFIAGSSPRWPPPSVPHQPPPPGMEQHHVRHWSSWLRARGMWAVGAPRHQTQHPTPAQRSLSDPHRYPCTDARAQQSQAGKLGAELGRRLVLETKKKGLNYYSTHSLHKENRSSRLRPVFIFDREPDKWQAACSDKALLWA